MSVRVTKETQPRVVLKGANSGTVNSGVLSGSGDGVRVSMTFTATAEPLIVIPYGNVAEAQLEAGSFATSYIPTSGSQVTRSADLASIPVSAFGYNQDAGTIVVEFGAYDVGADAASIVSVTDNPVTDDWVLVYANPSNIIMSVKDNVVSQRTLTVSGDRRTTGGIAGIAVKENAFAFTVDGSAPQTDSSGTMPTDVSVVRIGSWVSNPGYLNGHIKSLKYYPRRLTDTQLQELTS